MKRKLHKYVVVELVALVGIILVLTVFTPKIIGIEREDESTFFKFRNAHTILVDDNKDFSSPEKITDREIELDPGKYYWKAVGILGESEQGNFSIDSRVVVSMKVEERKAYVKNEGNVPVNATEKRGGVITGRMVIEEGEEEVVEVGNLSLEIEQANE